MLVRLYGKNFRSLKNNFELSMVAADVKNISEANRGTINVELAGWDEPLKLLRAVAIYGPNASGKSTVLVAGRAIEWLIESSSTRSTPDSPIPPYEPFLLDDNTAQAPIELGCDVIYQHSIVRYEISYTRDEIVAERLILIDEDCERLLINREDGSVNGELIETSKANSLYVENMQPNIAVISKLAQHGPSSGAESILPFYKAILRSIDYVDYSNVNPHDVAYGLNRLDRDKDYRSWVMTNLIRNADVGICDVETSKIKIEYPDFIREAAERYEEDVSLEENQVRVSFVHTGSVNRAIDYAHESTGTQKLLNIADDWWSLASKEHAILADELGASLHPRLLDRLIRAINEPVNDDVRSQLVFTTHETGLLESQDGMPPALRRDQVYFAQKTEDGSSELYSLAEFKTDARAVHNIRKRYMSGVYGAMPAIERISL